MDYIDNALICENGHMINDSMRTYSEYNKKFCDECGAKAISNCPECSAFIKGREHMDNVIDCFPTPVPKYCSECGNPYPWTKAKLEAVNELVDLMDELNESEKNSLKQSALEVSSNNPKTEVGVLKIKKYLSKVGSGMADTVKEIIVQVASETAIKYMEKQGML